jgi:hypothetical protein
MLLIKDFKKSPFEQSTADQIAGRLEGCILRIGCTVDETRSKRKDSHLLKVTSFYFYF